MTAVAAEAAVVVDNGRETSGETSLWHGAAAGAAARVDPLLRRIRGLTRFDRVSCGRGFGRLQGDQLGAGDRSNWLQYRCRSLWMGAA